MRIERTRNYLDRIWRSGDEMTGDIFTKNLPPSLFEYYGHKVYSLDKYYNESKTKKGKTCLKLIDYHKWIANDHLLIIENASNTMEAS